MTNAALFISCIMEIYIFYDYLHAHFDVKEKLNSPLIRILITLFISIAYFYINTLKLYSLNMFLFPFVLFFYATVLFDCPLKSRIVYIIFSCPVFWGCEFLFLILLGIPSFLVKENLSINIDDMPWLIFSIKLLTYIVFGILKQSSRKTRNRLSNRIFLYYLCIPVCSMGIMFLTYYSGIEFTTLHTKLALCTFFAFMQIGNILIFNAFQKYAKELDNNAQNTLILSQQSLKLEYYNQYQDINDKYKEFIHDTNHYLKTIGSLISEGESQKALQILQELNIELEENTQILYTENKILNSILTNKCAIAQAQNIHFDAYVEPGTTFGAVKDVDLIALLSNLLDNALEASVKSTIPPSVKVRIYMHNEGNVCVSKIENTFNKELLKKDGKRFLTSKKDEGLHGIGLKSVSHSVQKYGGYFQSFEEKDHFIMILVIPIKSDKETNS